MQFLRRRSAPDVNQIPVLVYLLNVLIMSVRGGEATQTSTKTVTRSTTMTALSRFDYLHKTEYCSSGKTGRRMLCSFALSEHAERGCRFPFRK